MYKNSKEGIDMNIMHNNTVNFSNYTIGKDSFASINDICKAYGNKILVIGGKTAIGVVK